MVANRQFHKIRQPASLRRQAGMGWLGWTVIVLMAGSVGLFGLRLVPIYMDYFHVLDVARTLSREAGVAQKNKNELRTLVAQRFRQNNLYKMQPSVLKFSKGAGQRLIVHIDYEERVNLFANIDIVAVFDKRIFQN